MDVKSIIEVVVFVLLGGASLYFKYNAKLNTKVNGLIDEAEATYKDVKNAGGEKNTYVIDKLYGFIPNPFKLLISREMVATIVNNTFSAMESYAIKQADKVVNSLGFDAEDEDARSDDDKVVEKSEDEIQG